MVLRRLLSWMGQRDFFWQDQFGFIPARDSTVALCTFIHDVTTARSLRQFVAAVCLDIKAAYDSVWLDNLIYKLVSIGVCGKMGLWISSFVHDRLIQVRWKSSMSRTGPCNQGVPQGSVLSPLLFIIYMLEIAETLEDGVKLIVYADDILVYAMGSDEDRARRKLQDTLHRISNWCSANKLFIAPDKCSAINFTRCRNPGAPIKLMGTAIPWSSPIKILGIWFTRTLTFTHHFKTLKGKVMKRLNYVKAIAGKARGINSNHLLCIINALIRSSLEYGAPLFYDSPPSALRILEVCYNSALRLATGLPSWTPIPILRREAGVPSIRSRLLYITKTFLLRLLASPPGIRLGNIIRSIDNNSSANWKWMSPLLELRDTVGPLDTTIRFSWPSPPNCLNFRVISQDLPFQNTTLPPLVVASLWSYWRAALPPCTLLATDASKDGNKTAAAAIDANTFESIASLVPHINSIFTAEALAIHLALSKLPLLNADIIVATDSLSVLRALESWSVKSPKVILTLLNDIKKCNEEGHRITFVWCPGHKGIGPNERADYLAGNGPYTCQSLLLTSPEDLRSAVKRSWEIENEYEWMNCEYASNFSFLTADRSYARWSPTRKIDVLLARWRTKTLITNQRLYQMGQVFSPLCLYCYDTETPDHILLHCTRLTRPRASLLNSLNLPPSASYDDVMISAFSSQRGLSTLIEFTKQAFPAVFQ